MLTGVKTKDMQEYARLMQHEMACLWAALCDQDDARANRALDAIANYRASAKSLVTK